MQELETCLNNFARVSLVDKSGISLSSSPHLVGRLRPPDLSKVSDPPRSRILKSGSRHVIHQLEIRRDLDFDVFSIAGLTTNKDSLFASERARVKFSEFGITGVDFVSLTDRDWRSQPQIGYPETIDLLNSPATLAPL